MAKQEKQKVINLGSLQGPAPLKQKLSNLSSIKNVKENYYI